MSTMPNGTKRTSKSLPPHSTTKTRARSPAAARAGVHAGPYQPNRVMKLPHISKPRFNELADVKQRNPLPTHNYGPGKRGAIILREELVEWVASLPKDIGSSKPRELPGNEFHPQNPRKPEQQFVASSRRPFALRYTPAIVFDTVFIAQMGTLTKICAD